MTTLQRRVTRLTALLSPVMQPDPSEEAQVLALQGLSSEDLELIEGVVLRDEQQRPCNEAEEQAMRHYRDALFSVARELSADKGKAAKASASTAGWRQRW